MKEFSKEQSLDTIVSILTKLGNTTRVSDHIVIYEEVMLELQMIADVEYRRGYMDAIEVGNTINNN